MKKIVSILLCVVLAFSSVSLFAVSASAAEEDTLKVNVTSNVPELFPDSSSEVSLSEGTVTVTYWFNTPDYDMLDAQFVLTYEREFLKYNDDNGVNRSNRKSLIIRSALDDSGLTDGVTVNTNPDSYKDNTVTGAIKGNCTNAQNGYDTRENARKAFISVTFNTLKAGETTVHLDLVVMGFRHKDSPKSSEPLFLVKGSNLIKDSNNNPAVPFVTDDSYTAAYAGTFNEKYIPAVPDENIRILSSLTLSLNLTMTFYVKKDSLTGMTDPYITVVYTDSEDPELDVNKTIYGEEVTKGETDYYAFVYKGVNPQRMQDLYTVTIYASKNGIIHYNTAQKGVSSYIYGGFGHDDARWYPIYVDLLNYGSAAQIYKGYHADSPINAGLSGMTDISNVVAAENAKIANLTATDYYNGIVEGDPDFQVFEKPLVTYEGVNLEFGTVISMNYYFNTNNTDNLDGIKVKVSQYSNNNGEKDELMNEEIITSDHFLTKNNKYYVSYSAMNAHQMNDLVYFTVLDSNNNPISNTTRFSVESEVAYRMHTANPSEEISQLIDVEKAILVYGNSAKEMIGE